MSTVSGVKIFVLLTATYYIPELTVTDPDSILTMVRPSHSPTTFCSVKTKISTKHEEAISICDLFNIHVAKWQTYEKISTYILVKRLITITWPTQL